MHCKFSTYRLLNTTVPTLKNSILQTYMKYAQNLHKICVMLLCADKDLLPMKGLFHAHFYSFFMSVLYYYYYISMSCMYICKVVCICIEVQKEGGSS